MNDQKQEADSVLTHRQNVESPSNQQTGHAPDINRGNVWKVLIPDENEICRQTGLQSAKSIRWDGYKWGDYQVAIVRQNHHISKLEAQRDELLEALKGLTGEIQLGKLNIRKDFSLMNAHAVATRAIYKVEGKQ